MGLSKSFKPLWGVYLYVAVVFVMLVSPSAGAEDPGKFPSKPITMFIQFGPGGSTDTTGRKLAEIAGKILGEPIVVENRPGGAGITAFTAVAKAAPDGYTIGTVAGPVVMAPHQRSVPFNPKEDFAWIMQAIEYTQGLTVQAESRWKTFKEFVEENRKNPGKLIVAHMGAKGLTHIILEQIALAEKVKFSYVGTSGGGEAISLLLGGHANALMSSELVHVRGGKVRALAIYSEGRYDQLPGVPTFAELGYKIEAPNWGGIFAPKGVDPRILKKLGDALTKAYQDPSFKELCATLMIKPVYKDPEAFQKMVYADFDSQAILLKQLGFTN